MSHINPAQARESITRSTETDTNKFAMYELATCRAENYLLKQRMSDCENTMHALRQMVASIADQQLEIVSQMVELRKNALMLPKVTTMDASTLTSDDGVLEYSESDDWYGTSPTSLIFSPYMSPRHPSSEWDSEPEVALLQEDEEMIDVEEEYDLTANSMSSWNFLYTINEEIEPEDAQEEMPPTRETLYPLLQEDN